MNNNRFAPLSRKTALALAATGGFLFAGQSFAHVGYGTALYDQATNTYAGSGTGGLNPTVSSNAGWASGVSNNGVNRTAALDTFADSHNNRFRFFTLTTKSIVSFTVTGTENSNGASKLNPGVSLFSGLVPAASHDGAGDTNGLSATAIATLNSPAVLSYLSNQPGFASWSPFYDANDEILANGGASDPSQRNKWGVFKSNEDFTMANNNGLVSTVTYLGSVADGTFGPGADGVLDNQVQWSGTLDPGTYTLTIGGTSLDDLAALFAKVQEGTPGTASTSCGFFGDPGCNGTQWPGSSAVSGAYANLRLARNMQIEFLVQPVPVPGAVWLFGSAIAGFGAFVRRRRAA